MLATTFDFIVIDGRLASMCLSNKNNFQLLAETEMAKYIKHCFLLPALKKSDLVLTSKAAICQQLINIKTRKLEMDFIFERAGNLAYVFNTISPAFTSSFTFSEMIVDQSRST